MNKPRREFKPYQRDIYYADEMDHYIYHIESKLKAIKDTVYSCYSRNVKIAPESLMKILEENE